MARLRIGLKCEWAGGSGSFSNSRQITLCKLRSQKAQSLNLRLSRYSGQAIVRILKIEINIHKGLPLVFGLIQLVILPFFPDSPGYLSSKANDEKSQKLAEDAHKFYGLEIETISDEEAENSTELLRISDPLFYKPLFVAGVMMLLTYG